MRVGPVVLLVLSLVACGVYQRVTPDVPPDGSSLDVPTTELPDPGECRIWIPGVPAAEQRPPGACPTLASQVPSGAWLLHRDGRDMEFVKVAVYHPERPGLLLAIHVYDAQTGSYLRNEIP